MSRHVLVDRPDCQVVLGFDPPLQSFFGQRFNPAEDAGTAIAGWPTSIGLGTRRPVRTHTEAAEDLILLIRWARQQQPDRIWSEREPFLYLAHLRHVLQDEWTHGCDHGSRRTPAQLTGPLS